MLIATSLACGSDDSGRLTCSSLWTHGIRALGLSGPLGISANSAQKMQRAGERSAATTIHRCGRGARPTIDSLYRVKEVAPASVRRRPAPDRSSHASYKLQLQFLLFVT